MSNIDLQDVNNFEVLQWNVAENITDIEEKECDSEVDGKEKSLLEKIFPPREWTCSNDKHDMKTWRQIISKELPTRSNVFSMITTLKKCEQFYKVKKTGVCEIRSALYNLFFDEMLRQVIIVDEEVGAILYRIRNEYKNMIFFSKLLLENGSICSDKYSNIPTKEAELTKEVEDLLVLNNEILIKSRFAKQKYSEALKKKQLYEDEEYLAKAEENHEKHMNIIQRSTEKLKEQLNMMSSSKALEN